ncbi:YbgC/FadM family acyl-CoA thioesterase [bacterium]|nr:YbgC/FadM family acyl-CoA thioesterase [bacterium]
MQIRIYYEDTDTGGVVYYANYLKYFERARTEYLREIGIDVLEYMEKNIFFTVVKAEVNYKYPARYGDLLEVETNLVSLSKAAFELENIIKNKEDGKLIVKGKVKMVCLNEKWKLKKLSEDFVIKLSNLLPK